MYLKNAFTLVELIVGITISMLLMTSVGMLVSGGMQNILKQQNIMNKNSLLSETVSDFYQGFENITNSGGYIFHSQSGAIFKINSSIDKGGFGYLGVINQSGLYCSYDSEFPNLDYLIWKSFIPYEEIGEDLFNNFGDIYTQTILSGSVTYTVDTLNNQILANNVVIIGGNVFGHELSNNDSGLNTRLNNPTAITLAEGGFFLSDTLNNRILFYKNNKVYLILDQNDGLNEPTGLAYDNLKNILYIANSGKGEILKLSAEILLTNPQLDISFSPTSTINSISRINLEFPEFLGNLDPINLGDISFNNINNGSGYIQIIGNTIEYYFTDYRNISEPITNGYMLNCTPSDSYYLNITTPEREIISCSNTNTGTQQIHSGDIYNNLNSSISHNITIQNISPVFASGSNYLVNIELFNNSISRYNDTFAYFTQGDGIVNNLEYTTLSTLISGLKYPTGLNISGNNLIINDFITRKQYSYDIDNITSFSTNNLSNFSGNNLENIPYAENIDVLLQNPIANLNLNYSNTDKFLSLQAKYYQYLNCYNQEEQVQKSFILQKNID